MARKYGMKTSTLEWIERHPSVVETIENLHAVSVDENSDLETIEKAEQAVIDEITKLGAQSLEHWLNTRVKHAAEQTTGRKHSKKNSV